MITIRPMEEKDAGEASRLEAECFSKPWSEQAFIDTIRLEYAYYFVAEENDNIIGICGLRNIAGEGEITNVAVKEEWRQSSVASGLMERILGEGEIQGIKTFTLEVRAANAPAIGLYRKYGFKDEGIRENFYENPREDALIMWKR